MDGHYFFIKRLNKGVTERSDFPIVEDQAHPGGRCESEREKKREFRRRWGEVPKARGGVFHCSLSLAPNFLRSLWTKTVQLAGC